MTSREQVLMVYSYTARLTAGITDQHLPAELTRRPVSRDVPAGKGNRPLWLIYQYIDPWDPSTCPNISRQTYHDVLPSPRRPEKVDCDPAKGKDGFRDKDAT
jgi:hypothetical protein